MLGDNPLALPDSVALATKPLGQLMLLCLRFLPGHRRVLLIHEISRSFGIVILIFFNNFDPSHFQTDSFGPYNLNNLNSCLESVPRVDFSLPYRITSSTDYLPATWNPRTRADTQLWW